MKKKVFLIAFVFLMMFSCNLASAEVITVEESDKAHTDYVYVAGNENFYPIEYYNPKTQQYEGVMPEILKNVSQQTGINFAYIHSDNLPTTELVNKNQIDMVSAYVVGEVATYAKEIIPVFSYDLNGRNIEVAFSFTEYADKSTVGIIESVTENITEEVIAGYFVANKFKMPEKNNGFITAVILCVILFFAAIYLFISKNLAIRKNKEIITKTDQETQMANLVYFEDYFNEIVLKSYGTLYCIAYIVIDSTYIQTYRGKNEFSDIVKYTAGVLNTELKENEQAARITENGFVFVFQPEDVSDAESRVDQIISKLNLFMGMDEKDTKPIFYSAVYSLSEEDVSCELLLFNLRRNCNEILGSKDQIRYCDMHMMNSAVEEKETLENFTKGLACGEFKLYLQFIVDNKNKDIVSCEALSRWEKADGSIVSPGEYISKMEKYGMILQLDYYMFEMVCRQLHKWKDTEFDDITISCNFTRITLSQEDFIKKINEITNKYVFEKRRLLIEITEDAMENDREKALENILECKKMGFRIALDDMGSGYTSLSSLCDYPIDIVKIDRDILLKIGTKRGKDLLRGMIALSHSLDLKVVCEGIETEEHNDFISNSDCDYIQGWFYSKVYPVKQGETFVRDYRKTKQEVK